MDISESEPLNAQYPNKVKELKKKLDKWLKDVDAKMPEADMQYDPKKESAVKKRWRTKLLNDQEKYRLQMFKEDWQPNKDWWGSRVED